MFASTLDQRLSDQDINAFVDGELDARRYRQVVQLLATDPGATERLGNFLRQHGDLAQLREHLEDVSVEPESATAELGMRLATTMRRHRRFRLASGAVSMLMSGLVAGWVAWGPDTGTMAERLALATSGAPQMLFGRDPLNGAQLVASQAGDGVVVDQQLAAYAIRRPDFAAHGFTFVGGNALKEGKAPAIRLVYKDEAARLVYLFVGTVGSDADVALTLVPEGHVSLNWRRGPLVFALIGPKDSAQLLELMQSTSEFLPPVPTLRPSAPTTVNATPVITAPSQEIAEVTGGVTGRPAGSKPALAANDAGTLGVTGMGSTAPVPVLPAQTAAEQVQKSL